MHCLQRVTVLCAAATLTPLLTAQEPTPQPVLELELRSNPRERLTVAHPKANAAIGVGLKWLADHQDRDGRWDADGFMKHDNGRTDGKGNSTYDIAATGLALLAFAREGKTRPGDTNRLIMLRGASWLTKQQDENRGLIGTNSAHDFIYGHAIATFAMCAVAASTDDVIVKRSAQRGINYLEKHRNPYGVWRYMPCDGDNDTSVTTWATLAYLAGIEIGLEVNDRALECVRLWIDEVTDENGRSGYSRRGEPSSRLVGDHGTRFPRENCEAMTAAAMLCRLGCGESRQSKIVQKSAALVLEKPAQWDPEQSLVDNCYWFFATAATRLGTPQLRQTWARHVSKALTTGQRQDGVHLGSWDPIGTWGESGGRVYSTAMSVMALQALYRLPE